MKDDGMVGHISRIGLSRLLTEAQGGALGAEDLLAGLIKRIALPMARKRLDNRTEDVDDAVQEIQLHILKLNRKQSATVENPEAWIRTIALNLIGNIIEKTTTKKRDKDLIQPLEENTDPPAPSENNVFPKETALEERYMSFPADLRAGIDRSLELINELFELRESIQKDRAQIRPVLDALDSIKSTRKAVSKTCNPPPSDRNLWRLFEFRELTRAPAFSGIPEKDREVKALLDEERTLSEKYEAIYLLWRAEQTLESKLTQNIGHLSRNDLFPGLPPWGNRISLIAGMRVSPESVVYRVWSRAPGFRIKNGKYRSRKGIAFAFQYHKWLSQKPPNKYINLFRSVKSIDFSNIEDIEAPEVEAKLRNSIDPFRKAGYGQALDKKYASLIKLILRLSFGPHR